MRASGSFLTVALCQAFKIDQKNVSSMIIRTGMDKYPQVTITFTPELETVNDVYELIKTYEIIESANYINDSSQEIDKNSK